MKVAVVFGGPSPEAEISRKSAQSVIKALKSLGHQVYPIELTKDLPFKLKEVSPDKVFLSLHGSPGEDGTVQGLLEIMGIPYTGCGVIASALTIDKDACKRYLSSYGIPVPSGFTLFKGKELPKFLEFPCIVKPSSGGSSVGTTLVKEEKEFKGALNRAFLYDSKVLVEEYLPGKELTVSVVNGRAFVPVEIVPASEFYDYESKYESSKTRYLVPAEISPNLTRRLKSLALKAYSLLNCKGAVRVDFKLDSYGSPYLLEVNTIPGLTERSLLPKAAAFEGLTFEELIKEMLEG
ncbi:D-alanine--D-alanine ligase family protein [Thermovibrio sp.]